MHLKFCKGTIQRIEEATGDLIGNKTGDKTTKASKASPQNNSDKVTNAEENIGFVREIPTNRYISSNKRQKITHDLRLIWQYNNGVPKIINLLHNTPNQHPNLGLSNIQTDCG